MRSQYRDSLMHVWSNGQYEIHCVNVRDTHGETHYRLHITDKMDNLESTVEVLPSKWDTTAHQLRNYVAGLNPTDIQAIRDAVKTKRLTAIDKPDSLGFFRWDGKISRYYGGQCFDEHGAEIVKDELAKLPECKGRTETAIPVYREYIAKNPYRAIVFLYALGAVICGIVDRNIVLSLAGLSSRGKTSIVNIMMAMFAKPGYDKTNYFWSDTSLAIIQAMSGVYGVPFSIDDTELCMDKKELQRTFYQLASGTSRARIVKGNQVSERLHWATSIFITAENSVYEVCFQKGIYPRVNQLSVTDQMLFDDAEELRKLKQMVSQNYGAVGLDFVKHALELGEDEIKNLYDMEVDEVCGCLSADEDSIITRCAETVAVITLTGKLANNLFGLSIDLEQVRDTMLDTFRKNLWKTGDGVNVKEIYRQLYELLPNDTAHGEFVPVPSHIMKLYFGSIQNEFGLRQKDTKQLLHEHGLLQLIRGEYCGVLPGNVRGCLVKKDGGFCG